MIQRIQTLYLFFAGLIPIVLLFIPFANLATADGYYEYTAFMVRDTTPDHTFILSTVGNALLLIASSVLSFITIFLYKNRSLQLKLISVNMLVILAAICTIMYIYPKFLFAQNINLNGVLVDFKKTIIISFISAIGLYLSKKAIAKDEKMIRSADRLR